MMSLKEERRIIFDYKRGIEPLIICQLNAISKDGLEAILRRNGIAVVTKQKKAKPLSKPRNSIILSAKDINEMRSLHREGYRIKDIAKKYNISFDKAYYHIVYKQRMAA